MRAVELEQRAEVDVGDAVGVGQAEGAALEVLARARDAAAGRRVEPGVHAGHVPRARLRERADPVGAVAEQQHEVGQALGRVQAHDVPEDRLAADLDERLRQGLAGLAHARALSAAEDRHRQHRRGAYLPNRRARTRWARPLARLAASQPAKKCGASACLKKRSVLACTRGPDPRQPRGHVRVEPDASAARRRQRGGALEHPAHARLELRVHLDHAPFRRAQPARALLPEVERHRTQVVDHGVARVEQPEAVLARARGPLDVLEAVRQPLLVEAADRSSKLRLTEAFAV